MKSKCIVIICILYADMFRIYHFGVMLIMKHILILLNEVEIATTVFIEKQKQKHNFHNSTAFSFWISYKGFCSL